MESIIFLATGILFIKIGFDLSEVKKPYSPLIFVVFMFFFSLGIYLLGVIYVVEALNLIVEIHHETLS